MSYLEWMKGERERWGAAVKAERRAERARKYGEHTGSMVLARKAARVSARLALAYSEFALSSPVKSR